MANNAILQINSSGRKEGSLTRQLSDLVVKALRSENEALSLNQRDLSTGLPFVDESWIGANFTAPEERDEQHKATLSFSDSLVKELQDADHLIIASPIYNFSVPAVLKAWIDMIARARLTFRYTENGPEGLLKGKKAYLVMASGGVPIGSEVDFASRYLLQVMKFVGIEDVTVLDASQFDLAADNVLEQVRDQVNQAAVA
ncbi:FMN-dependent NADH-azoreductase [Aliikangiella marina]|uniref:FMN dependent NADH:quinone oxidoreductase n=1 Tax=Aliikangiella marina TaxID=1712262 RepID=A0A545TCQ9_9GAMM|nr:NAD(P)H-dependent oxidoreductase [Aliikangiella marina]TQV74966.1 FMN-dependent NADH-azoreductase [Aliikangiella marina]